MTSTSVANFINEWKSASRPIDGKLGKRIYNNLDVTISPSGRHLTARINNISSNKPNSGDLSKLLSWITKRADRHNIILTMCVQPVCHYWNKDNVPSKDKLKEIAERYGFELKFEYPDGEGYEMFRSPIERPKM